MMGRSDLVIHNPETSHRGTPMKSAEFMQKNQSGYNRAFTSLQSRALPVLACVHLLHLHQKRAVTRERSGPQWPWESLPMNRSHTHLSHFSHSDERLPTEILDGTALAVDTPAPLPQCPEHLTRQAKCTRVESGHALPDIVVNKMAKPSLSDVSHIIYAKLRNTNTKLVHLQNTKDFLKKYMDLNIFPAFLYI